MDRMPPAEPDFQRARRPEQVRARRATILEAARSMLQQRPVADISLRELSGAVGLAKSNVLRYFDSREAIFLEVLDDAWTSWLDALEPELSRATDHASRADFRREATIGNTIATSLAHQPLLCELISTMAGVLERNISVDFARSFKYRAAAHTDRLARIVREELPHLGEAAAAHFAGAVFIIVAGLWPYARPTEPVALVTAEMGAPPADIAFSHNLSEGLINQLVGLSARASGR
jgi:AcrR family transcriptional regulator